MLSMIKYLPLALKVFKRARVLAGASGSNTTAKQKMVALPVALAIAGLGYFIPALADDAVAFALVAAAVGYVAPYVSRLIAHKTVDNTTLMLVAVRMDEVTAWVPYTGTVLDAREEGYMHGCDSQGDVYALDDGVKAGTMRLKHSTQAESDETMRAFVKKLRQTANETPEQENK